MRRSAGVPWVSSHVPTSALCRAIENVWAAVCVPQFVARTHPPVHNCSGIFRSFGNLEAGFEPATLGKRVIARQKLVFEKHALFSQEMIGGLTGDRRRSTKPNLANHGSSCS